MLFGFARSFISMGRDGILFKRFINHDPYNPVSLFSFSAKPSQVYVFLLRPHRHGRRAEISAFQDFRRISRCMPVIGFALLWQGGDMERYLPLFPLLFLWRCQVRCAAKRSSRLFGPIAVVFVSLLVVTNLSVRPITIGPTADSCGKKNLAIANGVETRKSGFA